jgi:hypothetical protein
VALGSSAVAYEEAVEVDEGPELPVTLPVDLPRFLEHLERALDEAADAGDQRVARLDLPALIANLRAVYVVAALKRAGQDLGGAAELLAMTEDDVLAVLASTVRC